MSGRAQAPGGRTWALANLFTGAWWTQFAACRLEQSHWNLNAIEVFET